MDALFQLLAGVVGSWQVIFITVAIVGYFSLVSYVAKSHHRARMPRQAKPKKAAPPAVAQESADASGSDDDVLLEE
ncbi:MAG: hypothetical protein LBQ35_01960 [Spirochaetaceae bacterium]|jgi:hypothetical protein|nr:hypothetical protein [Spirochaetaceae bacterium]